MFDGRIEFYIFQEVTYERQLMKKVKSLEPNLVYEVLN